MRKILFFFSFLCASLCAVVTSHADEALLGNIKQTKDIAMLRLGLRHADARIRAASASRLGDLGDDASATIPALVGMFADPVSQVRASAAFSLSQMGAQALSALREALVHPNENYRIGASSALSEMGQGAQDAFDALAKATQDPQALVRGYAVRALGNLGPKSRLALPEISRALRDSSSIVRRYAGEAIQKIGAPAIPTLLKIIEASHHAAHSNAPTVASAKSSTVSSTKRRIRRVRRKPSQATGGIASTPLARTRAAQDACCGGGSDASQRAFGPTDYPFGAKHRNTQYDGLSNENDSPHQARYPPTQAALAFSRRSDCCA